MLVAELAAAAGPCERSPIPRVAGIAEARGTTVLNAALLVAPDAMRGFQRTLTSIVERHAARGVRFDFTEPWPAYHFAAERQA